MVLYGFYDRDGNEYGMYRADTERDARELLHIAVGDVEFCEADMRACRFDDTASAVAQYAKSVWYAIELCELMDMEPVRGSGGHDFEFPDGSLLMAEDGLPLAWTPPVPH